MKTSRRAEVMSCACLRFAYGRHAADTSPMLHAANKVLRTDVHSVLDVRGGGWVRGEVQWDGWACVGEAETTTMHSSSTLERYTRASICSVPHQLWSSTPEQTSNLSCTPDMNDAATDA